ncbi:kinase-like domain-containing protein [Aspergillus pseudonomiae]|uniref:non-specific serine/threonine protein kinase n=2 Tax=Aspergillus subgen. Circumdati TaxID=2720871 RepID=A0A0L1INH0_ASPN3|nr:G2-specific protein kinase nimA [Aspergillus nomiae NRRL 13137]XP_031935898.1 kinase-like domain-containing protein [Aspergillus pseudonomiae]KAB8255183.1 kinase-like domain-containing protein [Aspergillus pseudonomiae]KAE8398579.1 kinase-like domain-containing protein [Aspergillus pseudonomiae]KNG80778.1 G2-specific protein kinase nimA [Aspergillus nomiae NRRL 13137]
MAIALAEADKYEVLEKIGCGSFGIIRKVRRKTDGFILCRKEINYIKMSQKEREQLTAEFNILSSLRHPNIVAYYHREHLKASQDLYLYMEYCGGGDLSMVIKNLKKTNKYAEEEFVWRILSQLVTALYRCHYGADPADVGSNILGPAPKPSGLKGKQAQMTILHRDLKPENIFLGHDNTVKLGDFGLSKLMNSHDFASTYVGTPFYMSPEICAAEKYTLRSDIWAVGCIMYELCQREPPFNARTHIQLVQRIREGKFAPLPEFYSPELKNVIASCLRVNPDHRPDTTALINLPIIRLMRKEKEVVDLSSKLRKREESALQKAKEVEQTFAKLEKERQQMKSDIESSLRREWEVKARLEIDRQVQNELDRLRKRFETEVQDRVAIELEKQKKSHNVRDDAGLRSSAYGPRSSTNNADDTDLPSTTDISQLSMESPANKPLRRETRTPFNRSKTVVESPVDVQMAEPSPISIASLSLSPRRTSATSSGKNIFAEAERQRAKWEPTLAYSDDEDDTPDLPSPTRPKVKPDPFKAPSRPLLRQNTAALMQKLSTQPPLFPSNPSRLPQASGSGQSDVRHGEPKARSPHRRLSKIPSSANLAADAGSPTRKSGLKQHPTKVNGGGEEMFKAVMQRNMGGRTLVELAQARAGGRPVEDLKRCASDSRTSNCSSGLKSSDRDPPAVWDPEKDEMPSPFLARGRKVIRNLR